MSDLKELVRITKVLNNIATEYAKHFYECGGSLYSSASVSVINETFHFQIGPSTSGMGEHVSLPLSMLEGWTDTELIGMVRKKKEELAEERKRNTCSSCGHSNFNHSYFNLGRY
jgi:hypothetical protein